MPCLDNGPRHSGDFPVDTDKSERLNIATRLACTYCSKLERDGEEIPDYAKNWWERHKREDAERAEREKAERGRAFAREVALSKLTESDKRALGL